ncbi:MAG TPA: maleylpyruvate isomerase N-terminal domain-containing protein [Blastocatellia bacterium]|nr:maleylpyruvate isomerase N-terminal domain-containing protein [Blastocatellia bacterium]
MESPKPILVTALFPEVHESLLVLLSGLSPQDWHRPTVCARWSVKDIATHLLGGQLGILSRKRDGYAFSGSPIIEWNDLVTLINELNDVWVRAASRLSPRLLCDLLALSGDEVCAYFKSLDPYAIGSPVDWAGPDPAPVWLDLAREYTEWWHHQQQIRDAVGKPGLKEPRFFSPVLDAFVRALPHTYRHVEAKDGTVVALTISGDSGGRWILVRENEDWRLYTDAATAAAAEIAIDQEIAWRLFTKGVSPDKALSEATLFGDQLLASKALEMISVIA